MVEFRYSGITIEVSDRAQAERISKIVERDIYTIAAIEKAAPGMMLAIRVEHGSCLNIGAHPDKFIVEGGKVKAVIKSDRRHMKSGTRIGSR